MVTNSSKIVSLADGDLSPAFISRARALASPLVILGPASRESEATLSVYRSREKRAKRHLRRREAGENHLPDHAV
jgi:hypothetical protein